MKSALPFALALFVLLTGCGGSGPSPSAEAPSGPPATIDEATGATVSGKVAFNGTAPAAAELDMSANPVCARSHPAGARSEEVVVNPNGTLRNVLVRVKSGLAAKKWAIPSTPVVVDQVGCIYVPHVAGVMTGQPIEFRNSDNTNHNIHPAARNNPVWNESQPPKGDPKTKSFAREEIAVRIGCNVHPWMRAYIAVVSNPFYAVTGDDGTFTLKGLPPGTYTIETWHEKYGVQEQSVTVGPKELKSVDFSYKS